MSNLNGRTAIVTGGAQGLGAADARVLAERGARVVITDIDEARGRALAAELDGDFFRQDVSDEPTWDALMAYVLDKHRQLDVLVNNAGIAVIHDIESATTEEWRRTQSIHLDGTFWGCQRAVKAMKARGGSIINMSSIVGLQGSADYIAYSAAKGGIRSLTKSVAAHCRRQGYAIRCNSVHPGAINTQMVQAALRHSSNIDLAGAEDQEAMRLQLGLGEPLDIANMVAFLASDDAKHVNGAEMVVDNGATAILAG